MSKVSRYWVLIFGIISPVASLLFYVVVYGTLTHFSHDPRKDWVLRLSISTAAMVLPILFTLALAMKESRRQALFTSSKVGLFISILSLGLVWKPVSDGITRSKQIRNEAMLGVPAPLFDSTDIFGKRQSLENHKGAVVLVNIWATWCAPCRNEMPKLDHLYQERKQEGFIVFGMSDENVEKQRKFAEQVGVTYPLLVLDDGAPSLYRDIARYPATFLIDRQGRLRPAPDPEQPFEDLEAAVTVLLKDGS
jgi:peroxiredoxin